MTAHPGIIQQLEKSGIVYRIREHAALGVPIRSPREFAQALGYSIARISKSLLLRGQSGQAFVMAVCQADKKLDLASVSEIFECGRLELASREELLKKTGYPPTGVSPVGIESIRIVIDENLLRHETILIGGGEVGVEVEIGPQDLVIISKAVVGQIIQG